MFCRQCGTENKDDVKFCKKCGAEFLQDPVELERKMPIRR